MEWRIFALAWTFAWSLVAFAAMAADKRSAQRGRRRTRETSLLLLALVGGSPGVAIAMVSLRHKTRKLGFLVRLLLTVTAQAIALAVVLWRP